MTKRIYKVGQFGKFWNNSKVLYVYGFLTSVDNAGSLYMCNGYKIWDNFEPIPADSDKGRRMLKAMKAMGGE